MNIREAYNSWSVTYDSVTNKTRDLEGKVLQQILSKINYESVLEIGCGTGKNTSFFIESRKQVTAVDFSEEMLAVARSKFRDSTGKFVQADINKPWNFTNQLFDLVTFSLVLEHIQNLREVFTEAASKVRSGGYIYLGELHPFKQYQGSKARFETADGLCQIECFTHNISEYYNAGQNSGLICLLLEEWFDEEKTSPRILTMLFQKK